MEITMLNAMASESFETSLDRQRQWGIGLLDVKDGIYGKACLELSDEEAGRAAEAVEAKGLSIYCLTTDLFKSGLELGGREFVRLQRQAVNRTLELVAKLRPAHVRALTPPLADRANIADAPGYLYKNAPWLYEMLRETADRLADVGVSLFIENEPEASVFSHPDEVLEFFACLGRPGLASFTYDVQNLWQMGTFPTLDVYRKLKPVVGYLHVKGGIADPATGRLKWRSPLSRASWPAADLIREAAQDGALAAICLNPSHGIAEDNAVPGDPVREDLEFVGRILAGGRSEPGIAEGSTRSSSQSRNNA